ncbi:MFS transporter [Ralstonia sp. UBA689]|uniref:MFS transporter n=1 Tax=Ralstonia sp. UBA689 TaxID=1947373 RepID=UPI0025CE4BDA|nr:MFS transporter [Ralstonia sp. UBA689]
MTPMLSPGSPAGRRLVLLLGLAQTVSWGTLYFTFTVFLAPMHDTLGWARPFLAGGFSLGLLVWALCSFWVGRALDRWPARRVMSAGTVLAAGSLLAWSLVGGKTGETAFLLLWLPMGMAMSTTLYDPAFVVLRQAFGDAYQRPIIGLTLIAGFSSTICIPLAHWGVEHIGWRHTLHVFALAHVLICLPIHARLRVRPPAYAPADAIDPAAPVQPSAWRTALRMPVFWAVVVAFVAVSLVNTVLGAHLIPLLTEKGVPTGRLLLIAALIGPAQVLGRLAMMRFRLAHPVRIAPATYVAMALALVLLALSSGPLLIVFALVYGAANGINTMVRAIAMPELVSRSHYATLNGLMMTPVLLAQASAPWLSALLWKASGGYAAVEWAMVAAALVALMVFSYGLRHAQARPLPASAQDTGVTQSP